MYPFLFHIPFFLCTMINLINLFRKKSKVLETSSVEVEGPIESIITPSRTTGEDRIKTLLTKTNLIKDITEVFRYCMTVSAAKGIRCDSTYTSLAVALQQTVLKPIASDYVDFVGLNHYAMPYFGLTQRSAAFGNDRPLNYKDLFYSIAQLMKYDPEGLEKAYIVINKAVLDVVSRHITVGGKITAVLGLYITLDAITEASDKTTSLVLTYSVRFDEKLAMHGRYALKEQEGVN